MPHPFPTTPLAADEPQDTRWLWRGRIPLEAISSLQGDGGAGKSTLLRWLAARVSMGDLPGDLSGDPGNVLWLNIEEHAGRDIRPGLNTQGADASRVFRPNGRGRASIIRFPRHLERLRDNLIERSARLVVIDQANAFFRGREQELREAMLGLREIAEDRDCAIMLNRNLNGARGADPYRRDRGGGLFVDICRAAYHLGIHPDDDQTGRRVLAWVKPSNIRGAASQALVMTEDATGRLVMGDEVDLSAADLQPRRDSRRTEQRETSVEGAAIWLQEHLDGHELPTEEVVQAAGERGISRRTLERARAEIGVLHRRIMTRNPDGASTHQTMLRLPGFTVPVDAAATPPPPHTPPAPVEPSRPLRPGSPAAQGPNTDDASIRFRLLELDAPSREAGGLGGPVNGAPILDDPSPPVPPTGSGDDAERTR